MVRSFPSRVRAVRCCDSASEGGCQGGLCSSSCEVRLRIVMASSDGARETVADRRPGACLSYGGGWSSGSCTGLHIHSRSTVSVGSRSGGAGDRIAELALRFGGVARIGNCSPPRAHPCRPAFLALRSGRSRADRVGACPRCTGLLRLRSKLLCVRDWRHRQSELALSIGWPPDVRVGRAGLACG